MTVDKRLLVLLLGLLFLAAGWAMQFTVPGTSFSYKGAFTWSTPGTMNFWLAYLLLILPGSLMIGYAIAPAAERIMTRVRRIYAIPNLCPNRRKLLLILFTLCAVLLADLGNRWVMQRYPLTDDEWVARFGGQVLASGTLGVRLSEAETLNPQRFTVELTDGRVTSFEWLGGQVAWAIAEITHTDGLIFAVCAGLTLVATVLAATIHLGQRQGWIALLLFLCSPMAVAVSVLTHTHTVARMWVAFAVMAWVIMLRRDERKWAFVLGLSIGAGVLTRPAESLLLFAPFAGAMTWDALRLRSGASSRLLFLTLGGLGPLLIMLWYNIAITGDPLSIPRWHETATGDPQIPLSLLERFGSNFSHNLMMLSLWFAGPLGIFFLIVGLSHDRTMMLLGGGVGLLLFLALMHSTTGIHMVGPINYSETAVPLVIISTAGASRLFGWWHTSTQKSSWLSITFIFGLSISGTWFNVHSLSGLRQQSKIHAEIFRKIHDELERQGIGRALIVAPRYLDLWYSIPSFREIGTFVYDWPRPNPFHSDRIIYLSEPQTEGNIVKATANWPEFIPLRLVTKKTYPYIELVGLDIDK